MGWSLARTISSLVVGLDTATAAGTRRSILCPSRFGACKRRHKARAAREQQQDRQPATIQGSPSLARFLPCPGGVGLGSSEPSGFCARVGMVSRIRGPARGFSSRGLAGGACSKSGRHRNEQMGPIEGRARPACQASAPKESHVPLKPPPLKPCLPAKLPRPNL